MSIFTASKSFLVGADADLEEGVSKRDSGGRGAILRLQRRGRIGRQCSPGCPPEQGVPQLLSKCSSSLRNVSTMISAVGVVARKYGLSMVTYESGQSLVEYNVMAYSNGETPGLTSLPLLGC